MISTSTRCQVSVIRFNGGGGTVFAIRYQFFVILVVVRVWYTKPYFINHKRDCPQGVGLVEPVLNSIKVNIGFDYF